MLEFFVVFFYVSTSQGNLFLVFFLMSCSYNQYEIGPDLAPVDQLQKLLFWMQNVEPIYLMRWLDLTVF